MAVKMVFNLLVFLCISLNLCGSITAAPLPPVVIVDPETRQCAVVTLGDECMDCEIPAGWEELGTYPTVQCPQGYTEVDPDLKCKGFQTLRCCLPGHSGAQGDCLGLALRYLLICLPCLLLLAGVVFLVVWLVRRKKRSKSVPGVP